jgi:hypothetical protein
MDASRMQRQAVIRIRRWERPVAVIVRTSGALLRALASQLGAGGSCSWLTGAVRSAGRARRAVGGC